MDGVAGRKYVQVMDGEWFELMFTGNPPVHSMACCDCGLVHKVQIKVDGGKIFMMAVRDKRATARRRKSSPPPPQPPVT